jgi:hypothetical protein
MEYLVVIFLRNTCCAAKFGCARRNRERTSRRSSTETGALQAPAPKRHWRHEFGDRREATEKD